MKYFTPDLLARLDSNDPEEANAADAEWDRLQHEYERQLQQLTPRLPAHVRAFNELLLHDARVLSLARQGSELMLILRKDIPPRDLVCVTYTLTDEPVIDRQAVPASMRSPVMEFQYDEFGVVDGEAGTVFAQSILFSNGWEVTLRFSDVRFVLAEPLYAQSHAEVA